MPPITPEQFSTPGSKLTHDGDEYTVVDTIQNASGATFIVVSYGDSPVCGLLPASLLTEDVPEFSVPNETDDDPREQPVTDVPVATVPQEPVQPTTPETPPATPPASQDAPPETGWQSSAPPSTPTP